MRIAMICALGAWLALVVLQEALAARERSRLQRQAEAQERTVAATRWKRPVSTASSASRTTAANGGACSGASSRRTSSSVRSPACTIAIRPARRDAASACR